MKCPLCFELWRSKSVDLCIIQMVERNRNIRIFVVRMKNALVSAIYSISRSVWTDHTHLEFCQHMYTHCCWLSCQCSSFLLTEQKLFTIVSLWKTILRKTICLKFFKNENLFDKMYTFFFSSIIFLTSTKLLRLTQQVAAFSYYIKIFSLFHPFVYVYI